MQQPPEHGHPPADPARRHFVVGGVAAALTGCAASPGARHAVQPGRIEDLDAVAVVHGIRTGELRAESYVSALLHRTQAHASLNAYAWIDRDRVLEQARAVDLRRARGEALGLLEGLPLAVKDNIDTRGYPTSAGTPALKSNHPGRDAPVMQTLFAQGAILLGKTNMHELAVGGTSSNPAFGFVRNPYDPGRIAGGSSGGTAAAIAARLAPAGLGTDTAGSVRIPAAFCGIAGFRPTTAASRGAYSIEGVVPLALGLDTIGPMARTVADVALLDAAIVSRKPPEPASLRGLRLGLPRAAYWEDLEPGVARSMESTLARLREQGVVFVEVDLQELRGRALELFGARMLAGFGRDLSAYLAAHVPGVGLDQVVASIRSRDVKNRFMASARSQATPPDAAWMADWQAKSVQGYRQLFQRHGIQALVFPTEPLVAPPILEQGDDADAQLVLNGKQVSRVLTLIRNTRETAGVGLPGLSIPVAVTAEGLPVGLEIDGLPQSDAPLLAIGMGVEAALGRIPAPPEIVRH